jgi:uncharacterized membrane protein
VSTGAEVDPLRHHRRHSALLGAFGQDAFGRRAERAARFFGTPQYIVGQTIGVIVWISLNSIALVYHFDAYPFILLNLAFSTQAAYAAPLILLAQTRQADRDKATAEADAKHREELSQRHEQLLQVNTELTEAIKALTDEIHDQVCRNPRTG